MNFVFQGPGAAALAIAVSAGHKALVEEGLGKHVAVASSQQASASMRACANVKELLAARADPEEVSERGQSPLMLAAALSRRDLCEELLAASAQPDGIDPEGKSALVLAAGAGCLPVCEVLLEARADLAQRTVAGACALDSAAANGHQAGPGFSKTHTYTHTNIVSRLQMFAILLQLSHGCIV